MKWRCQKSCTPTNSRFNVLFGWRKVIEGQVLYESVSRNILLRTYRRARSILCTKVVASVEATPTGVVMEGQQMASKTIVRLKRYLKVNYFVCYQKLVTLLGFIAKLHDTSCRINWRFSYITSRFDSNCQKQTRKFMFRLLIYVRRSCKGIRISWNAVYFPMSAVFHGRGWGKNNITESGILKD